MKVNYLKPCPFCESENVHAYIYKDAIYRQYAVKCKKCGARIMARSTELAIEKWNRRAERKIIHCKDCKFAHLTTKGEVKYCDVWFPETKTYLSADDFCSSAEKRGE